MNNVKKIRQIETIAPAHMLIEHCVLCEGELKPASPGPHEHLYCDYYYDESGESETEVGVVMCPTCKFVLSDERYWDGDLVSVGFAYDDKFLDQMFVQIKARAFRTSNPNDPGYKKLMGNLPKIKERIQAIKDGKVSDPFEK